MKSKLLFCLILVLSISLVMGCSGDDNEDQNPTAAVSGTESQNVTDTPGATTGTEKQGDNDIGVTADPGNTDNAGKTGSEETEIIMAEPIDLFLDKKITDVSDEEFIERIDALKAYKLDLGSGFEGFETEVNDMYDIAVDYMKIGAAIPSIYGFTFAQGSVSSLRYAVGLLLKEKGETVSEDGLICNWDDMYGISLTTPVPYFMEAISVEKTNKEKADLLIEYGSQNPLTETMIPDTDMLKGLGTGELKTLYGKLTDFEKKLYEICIYVPLKVERSKNGFSSEYHMLITKWYLEQDDIAGAAESVENIVLTDPFSVDKYSFAAYVNLGAGDLEKAAYYVNNGLLLDDRNGDINLFASLIAFGMEDADKAKNYLSKAKQAGVSEQYKDILSGLESKL